MPHGGVGERPDILQMGAPGPWQMAMGLNVATKVQEQLVVITTISCSDRLGCRASAGVHCHAGSTGFALCGAGLEGKAKRLGLKHLWCHEGNRSGGLLKAAGM